MNRESKLWLTGAGAVAIVVLAVIALFGIRRLPEIASLYDPGTPSLSGSVAYIDSGHAECVNVLDVATGESREVYCADWLWLEGWDSDGNLRVQSGDGADRVLVIDPTTGAVVSSGDIGGMRPEDTESLYARATGGRATLTYGGPGGEVTLIDVDGPRDYAFWNYGLTDDGRYVWVCDSENRLLVVASDGSGGPWLVADDIRDPAWRDG
jgi:hypothetical protein